MRPLQRRYHVQHAHVPGIGILFAADGSEVEVTEQVQPVVHRHYHHVPGGAHCQIVAVKRMRRARASRIAAAVQPHHHRPLATEAGREHIHHQAIFAFKTWRGVSQDQRIWRAAELGRCRPVLKRVANACPWLRFAGRHEAIAPCRRCAVGYASERVHALLDHATEFSGSRFHDGCLILCR